MHGDWRAKPLRAEMSGGDVMERRTDSSGLGGWRRREVRLKRKVLYRRMSTAGA